MMLLAEGQAHVVRTATSAAASVADLPFASWRRARVLTRIDPEFPCQAETASLSKISAALQQRSAAQLFSGFFFTAPRKRPDPALC
jgi:hypothetical protein